MTTNINLMTDKFSNNNSFSTNTIQDDKSSRIKEEKTIESMEQHNVDFNLSPINDTLLRFFFEDTIPFYYEETDDDDDDYDDDYNDNDNVNVNHAEEMIMMMIMMIMIMKHLGEMGYPEVMILIY